MLGYAALRYAALLGLGLCMSSLSGCEDDEPLLDAIQPMLEISSPQADEVFPFGSTVDLSFTASDNDALVLWIININNINFGNSVWADADSLSGSSISINRTFIISATQATEYEMIVTVVDASGNEAIRKRRFYAGP